MELLPELPKGFRWSFDSDSDLPTLELHKRWLFFWMMQDYEPVSLLMVRTYGLDSAKRMAASSILRRNPILAFL